MSRTLSDVPTTTSRSLTLGWTLIGGMVVSLWLFVFWHIHTEWIVNTVYAYGWAVPALAGFLAWERWNTRPWPQTPAPGALLVLIALALLAAFVPVRVIQEANPDWVKINWSMMGIVSLLSLLVAAGVGGLRYFLHFAFPVVFCFTALPWPIWLEDALVQNLMKGNADVCAEVLTIMGMPAIAQGNLIQIADTWVNVEEACSGIRSLQTAFMMGLFLGEFHRFGLLRRGWLLFLALFAAAFGNMIRTIVLAYCASQGTIDKWHDTVGNIAMVVTLIAIWLIGEWLRRGAPKPSAGGDPVLGPAPKSFVPPLPAWACIAGILLVVGAEAGTEAWYRYHEARVAPAKAWHMAWPETARNFAKTEFHERSIALLKFNFGENAAWIDSTGYRWQAYFLRWDPGRVSKYLAMSHYPTVCLPATGLKLVSETGAWDVEVNGIRIPFNTYVFDEGGRDVYVFHAIIEDRPLQEEFRFRYYQVNSSERIDSVLRGERNLGQKVVGIAIRGCSSPVEAREQVESELKKLVQVQPGA